MGGGLPHGSGRRRGSPPPRRRRREGPRGLVPGRPRSPRDQLRRAPLVLQAVHPHRAATCYDDVMSVSLPPQPHEHLVPATDRALALPIETLAMYLLRAIIANH